MITVDLPEEILRDDVATLREELDDLRDEFFRNHQTISNEIKIRIAQAKARGFNVEAW